MTKSSTDLGGDQIPVTSPPSQNSWSLGYLSESVNKEHDEEPRLSPMTTSDYLLHKPTTKSQVESTAKVDRVNYTTTTSTTTLGPCGVNFTEPEGDIEITQQPNTEAECFYLVTVYLGYGIEVQVSTVKGVDIVKLLLLLTVEDTGGSEPFILAKDSALKSGLVLRSQSNQITVRFTSGRQQKSGFLLLHYQASMLSCSSPRKPSGGEVSVTHLHVGGEARFHCFSGYTLQGPRLLMCHNATTPYWSGKEPQCIASCGGLMKNATYGRITTPGFPGNYSNNLTCHWVLEVPEGHRLHIHFEKVALAEDDDRWCMHDVQTTVRENSPPIYDSYEVEYLPVEGVLSTGRYLFIEFTTDATVTSTGVAIRYEVPQNSYPTYRVGTTVEFSCDPGYTLEQGAVVIECVNPQNPQWNETEPACRAVCSGEVTDSAGVVLSPNWPEAYDKGQDCIWGIHVEEDKRIMLDIQVWMKNMRNSDKDMDSYIEVYIVSQRDIYTFIHTHIYTHMCIYVYIYIHIHIYIYIYIYIYRWFIGINRNWFLTNCLVFGDAVMKCLDPGNVEHSHKVISGGHFTVGATVQFICNKGYVLSGSSLLTCCNRDLAAPKWSERLPKCVPEKYEPCRNPGAASTSVQNSEKAFYQAGETLSFSCHSGYELQGQATIYCIPGHPSLWNSSPPACRGKHTDSFTSINMHVILVVLIPSAIILAVILGIYVYFSK
uniref:Seizure related 6 homolog a n=1 Tax=Cynoglossus semilaevis TaxID=244447 RepID=A0A3P8W0M0_CYNSE